MDFELHPLLKSTITDSIPSNGDGSGVVDSVVKDITQMSKDLHSPELRGLLQQATSRHDGWRNVLQGLGTNLDKRVHTKYTASNTTFLDKNTLSGMYANDGMIQRIVGSFADDMTRQWLRLPLDKRGKGEDKGKVEKELERLNAPYVFNKALRWARLMGGSLLFIGANDGQDVSKPLNVRKIKTVEHLRVFDLGEVDTAGSKFVTDVTDENFGRIETYKIRFVRGNNSQSWDVHESRCIPFHGIEVPPSTREGANIIEQRYWGVSAIQPVWEYLRDFSGAMGSVSQILYEFVIGKYKLSDLDEILAQGNERALNVRVQAIEMTKSILHAVLLGTDEDYTRDAASVTGIPDTLDRFMMILSSVTEIPVTRLFGRAPAGLNATGENDLRNYYDAVKSKQSNELTPAATKLINIVCAAIKEPNPPSFEWNPLIQLSEKERSDNERVQAETYRTQADADQRYVQEGVLDPEDIYKMRFEDTLGKKDFTEFFGTMEEPDGPDRIGAEEDEPKDIEQPEEDEEQ